MNNAVGRGVVHCLFTVGGYGAGMSAKNWTRPAVNARLRVHLALGTGFRPVTAHLALQHLQMLDIISAVDAGTVSAHEATAMFHALLSTLD